MISSMITGAIIGLIAGALTSSTDRRGCFGNILLGLAGSWVGELLFDNWGPQLAGMSVIPSVLGAVLLIAIFDRSNKNH
ncbi:GlsB/YeaQ/YmgE family stress response membrane protein [Streptococcus suis]|nr:GlsB/YeaQ/YmgE family stress response membrane protein [Streptococcus suis]